MNKARLTISESPAGAPDELTIQVIVELSGDPGSLPALLAKYCHAMMMAEVKKVAPDTQINTLVDGLPTMRSATL